MNHSLPNMFLLTREPGSYKKHEKIEIMEWQSIIKN